MMPESVHAGGTARLLTCGVHDIASGPAGSGRGRCAQLAAATGMASAALLRVAAAESPAWQWSSLDVGSCSAIGLSGMSSAMDMPALDVQGRSLQVCATAIA